MCVGLGVGGGGGCGVGGGGGGAGEVMRRPVGRVRTFTAR